MRKSIIAIAVLLAACASSGPISIGQSTYVISKTSAGCGMASAASVKTDLYREAGAFCQKSAKELEVISTSGKDGIVMVRCASAEIQFSCVAQAEEGSPEYADRKRRQEERIARENVNQPSETLLVSPPPIVVQPPASVQRNVNCTSIRTGNTVNTNCN